MKLSIPSIYKMLYRKFGPQHWWPADTFFEVMVGAILTQNTNWSNVEKAISNLKAKGLLTPRRLSVLSSEQLSSLIRPAGYYNIKTQRLNNFLKFFLGFYKGDHKKMAQANILSLRQELLRVKGIGPETADSILLYALKKPIFVVDAYTKRILFRHKLIKEDAQYEEVQKLFMKNLKKDVKLFNEYHALIVKLGKEFCL